MKPDDMCSLFALRHSVRQFSNQEVDIKDIGAINKAGLSAPCAMGHHASHLFVFHKDEDGYKKLINLCSKDDGQDVFYGAPVIILETVDENSVIPDKDGAAVIENMLLAASFLGLGGCWINSPVNVFNNNGKALKQIDVPAEYKVIGAVAIGYQKEQ